MGLERIQAVLAALGHPERACRWVHVAGTNGKGSTCAMIESALRASGLRTGLYTSPHLEEPTERIQIAGKQVSRELFLSAFQNVHQTAERLLASGVIDSHPTYFETVTAMAFVLFRDAGVETGVIEVGLGGRLDATNVITPVLSVITPIDFDHEAWLGSSLAAIAGEKAGIIKPGVPVVIAPQRPEAWEVLSARRATVIPVSLWLASDLDLHRLGCRFTAVKDDARIAIDCPLAGAHQINNALTAVAALHHLQVPTEAITEGIRQVRWPGRLELVSRYPDIILDGAHNPAGVAALAAHIQRFYKDRKVWLVYATMRDKSVDEISESLSPQVDEVILTAADSARSLRPEVMRELFPHPRVRVAARLSGALDILREASPGDAIFITGSLFLVGEARSLLRRPAGPVPAKETP
ncbi:MAG: bifunctional folylpolyglutamate synthase/dihydrofolate synthase [Acidobacteriia bacterium]|nr:bifunctional folylpolyglutamate synthase/dihydrofolate synthase [Terriglobia bacterium]